MKFTVLSQVAHEWRAIATGYPPFVTARNGKLQKGEIPVFVFHTTKPDEFEEALDYLAKNDYRTLSIHEYYRAITGQSAPAPRSVLLTVDDARLSFWIYGFPLLQKYRARATLFVIPGLTEEGPVRPSGLDIAYDLKDDSSICNWSELDELNASGLVDIESHSLFHQQIFVSHQVIDCLTPDSDRAAFHSLFSPYFAVDHAREPIDYTELYGLPIFATDSRMSGNPALRLSPSLQERARRLYREHTVDGRLSRSAKDALVGSLQSLITDEPPELESRQELLQAIETDLLKASEILKLRYGAHRGDHFCLPFTIGSDDFIQAAKQSGLKTCFWGIIPGKPINPLNGDPYHLVRLKHDFIFRLPGSSRRSLLAVYTQKINRRIRGDRIY